jgi:general nucleoside transport system permease protein
LSEPLAPQHGPEPEDVAEAPPTTVAARFDLMQRGGGILVPVITGVVAFLIGGVVIAVTGHNPARAYWDILKGAGFNWLAHPWQTDIAHTAAYNFSQTLLQTTTLILCGLAVAFAFRCGLFNIGGNGQYIVGLICANWIGVSFVHMARPAHIVLGIVVAAAAGAAWAAIAGFLKATVGAHEVITTIMLNWIALWIGSYLVGFNGPLQQKLPGGASIPQSADVAASAKLPVFWGSPVLQGLHIGIFIAVGALVVYWLILNRTTLGFEVRAVGFNAEAARYGGISVRRNYFVAMAISGAFAGLAGGIDLLGWEFHLDLTVVQSVQLGFIGIAVALLGRNSAIGVFFSALLFAALLNGTSTRNLDPSIFRPELAGNLARIIQGLVVLFVGADLLILYLWNARRKLKLTRAKGEPAS